jgi:predicted Zn-dependent peptidase
MFVAGKLPKNLPELLDKNFGDLANNKIELLNYAAKPAAEKRQRITNDPNGVQGAIRIARSFPNRHHPDFSKAQVLNSSVRRFLWLKTYGQHSRRQRIYVRYS